MFNTFYMWEIVQSVKPLCKHPNNKGQMGSQLVTKLWFHESQHRKAALIFHTTHYLHHGHSTSFTYFEKLQTRTQDVVTKRHIPVKGSKDWCQKVEPCMQLHLTSLLIWTCLVGYQGRWHWEPHAQRFWPHPRIDTPLSSLMDSTTSPKVKIMEGEGVGTRSLARSTSKVKGRARAPGWGLEKLISISITRTDLHKPNKLISA